MALVPLGLVTVKMLPFDNKSEFQVMVDMPEGTALETTARVASALASAALEDETVVNVQQYVGTSAPYNFNGLVRHYFLRRAPHLADLQVNLVPKGERSAQSHDVAATRARAAAADRQALRRHACRWPRCRRARPCCRRWSPKSTGPMPARRTAVAAQVKAIFEQTPGVVDTDWYVEAPQPKVTLVVDGEKAAAAGLSPAAVAAVVRMAGSGESAGLLHDAQAREDVPIVHPPAARRPQPRGRAVAPAARHQAGGRRRAHARRDARRKSRACITRTCRPVTYVTGDLAGAEREPGLRHPRR